jgi:hypothetical protein
MSSRTFIDVKPHIVTPDGTAWLWIVDPPGMVIQLAEGATITKEMVAYLETHGESEMRRRHPTTDKFFYVIDCARAEGYDTGGRQALTKWGKERVHDSRCGYLVPPATMNAITRMGVSAAFTVLNIAGLKTELADSADAIIAKLGLKPMP